MSDQKSVSEKWRDAIFAPKFEELYQKAYGSRSGYDAWLLAARAWVVNQTSIKWGAPPLSQVISAFVAAATMGLRVDGEDCSVQVRGNPESSSGAKCKCEIGYRGVIHLADEAGFEITCGTVRENDTFDYDEAEGWIKHKRGELFGGERGKTLGYYAIARRLDKRGTPRIATLSFEEAQKRKTKGGVWDKWPDEMGEKSVILKIRKKLYFGDDLEERLASTGAVMGDGWSMNQDEEEIPPEGPSYPPQSLKDKVAAEAARARQDRAAEAPQEPEPPAYEEQPPPYDDDDIPI